MDNAEEVIATAFSKHPAGMDSVANLARFPGAFYQFALENEYPLAGEDALVTIVQWLRPMHQRGYTAPRIALYALRVVKEAIGMQLPLTASAVLGAARTVRSKIRKHAPLTPHTLVEMVLILTQTATMPFGLRAFASGIALTTIAPFRWAGAQRITEINQNDSVIYGICQRTKHNSEPFYWDPLLWG